MPPISAFTMRGRLPCASGFPMTLPSMSANTWSRKMALSQGDYWGGNDPEVQDETNYRADYGPVTQNRTQILTLDAIYDAPFSRWLKADSLLKHVVEGW